MNFDTLFSNMNRSVDASSGYTHFQISRATIQALLSMSKNSPEQLTKLLELCMQVRGPDRRQTK